MKEAREGQGYMRVKLEVYKTEAHWQIREGRVGSMDE